jgi:hypothetical protein
MYPASGACGGWRLHVVWRKPIDLFRRAASYTAKIRTTDQVRVGHQPQDRQGLTGYACDTDRVRAGRRSDRIWHRCRCCASGWTAAENGGAPISLVESERSRAERRLQRAATLANNEVAADLHGWPCCRPQATRKICRASSHIGVRIARNLQIAVRRRIPRTLLRTGGRHLPRSVAASRDGGSSRLVSPVLSPARISVSSSLLEKATMSQKSSLPQPTQSVSWVLTADTSNKDAACISRQSQLEPSNQMSQSLS